ncbi:prepilin-type N-terminal cleavage/methylation domain-containing protein [Photobacterium aquae]|uniref:prepilin-type N-terminal cleavage/methylation domain-containing protein n=1 Tax=Photobacterium aquae TaxID=1195763 RepID=UPI00069D734B|nr:prepilin-type N-terminal cleavage/methylation domain-containing protein [Photobacterium aquae]
MARTPRGFTLVELIVVIVLIGIISVVAATRLIGRSSYDPYLNRDQAIAMTRQIQVASMNSELGQDCRQLVVSADYFGSPVSCAGFVHPLTGASDNLALSVTGLPDGVNSMMFNLMGQPYYLDAGNTPQRLCLRGCRFVFGGNRSGEQAVMAMNKEGYVYAE